MDTTTFVKKLKEIFIERNRGEKKYSQVWLSKIDLDGLYHSEDFVLKLKAAFTISDFSNETLEIIRLLNEKAKEEAKHIPRVSVYDVKESAHPDSDDIIIYEDASVLTY
jgi:hypothetical protein